MSEDKDTRIDDILKNGWIGYTRSNQILKSLNMLLRFPASDRMQNILIMGESNNGKTTIARRFFNKNPPHTEIVVEKETGHTYEIVVRPVLMVQCPHIPHEKRLYYGILDQLNLPYLKTTKAEYLQKTIINAFRDMRVKILILDEIHHILSGTAAKQREFLNLIKYISNEADVSIVALGTNEASYVLKGDRQLDTRFDKMVIPKWQYNEDFLRLLATIEQILPLKNASNLIQEDISKQIFTLSHGIIGEVIKLLKLAAIDAIESRTETITEKSIKQLNYSSPFENVSISVY